MGRSKIDISQIDWSEIASGSLAGPASFIGLDTSNAPVLIAASDYTSAGGSGISHDGSTADGILTYKDSDEATVESNLTFDGSTLTVAGDILVNQYIKHGGDENTLINFTDDEITFKAGGKAFLTLDEKASAPHEITFNDGANNIDLVIKGNGSNGGNPGMKFDASTNKLGINGVGTPSYELDVAGDIGLDEYIYHKGDDNTYIRFQDDDININCGGKSMVKMSEQPSSQDIVTINNGGTDVDFRVKGENEDNLIRTDAANDRVGIGTSSPDTTAHIMVSDASATSNAVSVLTLEKNDHIGLQFLSPNDKATYIMCGDPQSDFAGGIRYDHSDNSLAFKANGNYYFQITSAGAAKFSGSVELGDSIADNVFINGTLTGSNGIKLAGIPTGSLAGPASFLGVDTTNRVVQVAASDYVSAGGSDTFVLDHFGHFKWTNDNIMGHAAYGYNNRYNYINVSLTGKATYDDKNSSQMTASIVNSLLYIRSGIIPVACTLDGFTVDGYWTENLSDGNAKWSMWQCTPPSNATDYDGDVTWTRIGSVTWTGTGTDDHFYKGSTTISANNAYAAGDWWALTVQPGATDVYIGSSNSNFAMASTWSPT